MNPTWALAVALAAVGAQPQEKKTEPPRVPTAKALEVLKEVKSPVSVYRAVGPLVELGPDAEPIAAAVGEAMLRHEDLRARGLIAVALGHLGPAARPAVPHLIKALKDKEWMVRGFAGMALAEIGPPQKEAIPELTRLLKDGKLWPRAAAAAALLKLDPDQRETVLPVFLEAVKGKWEGEEEVYRQLVVAYCAALGRFAKELLPVLEAIASDRDENSDIREFARKVLNSLKTDPKKEE